jgi:periplasmic protein TonB
MTVRTADRAEGWGRGVGLAGTLVIHGAVVGLLLSQLKPLGPTPPVYAVELVAAPAPTAAKRLAREAVPTPPPQEKPAPVKPTPPKPAKAPALPIPKPTPAEAKREPPPKTSAPVAPAPGEAPSTGTDIATIKTPGLQFPFPEYLRNIVTQVYRNWDREAARQNSFAEISFLILRDGTVRDIRFVTRSGSFSFDLGAQGAIEAAGNVKAFGPLPDGWDADVLPVSFYFKPTGP